LQAASRSPPNKSWLRRESGGALFRFSLFGSGDEVLAHAGLTSYYEMPALAGDADWCAAPRQQSPR
jgi:hypothetical protein